MNIRPGDTVRLKSGGPAMTVGTVIAYEARCHWFDGSTLRIAYFQLDTLEPASPSIDLPPMPKADGDYFTTQVMPPWPKVWCSTGSNKKTTE